MDAEIASASIWGQRPGEEPFEIHLTIGTPYQIDEEHWACPVGLQPLFSKLADSHGGSSFQALCLASSLALGLLSDFKEKGNSLFYSPGEDFEFESYVFGVAAGKRGGA